MSTGDLDVAQQAAAAVGVVELGVANELDLGAGRRQRDQRPRRLASVALGPFLGRVDLHEADPAAVREPQRVPIRDRLHGAALHRSRARSGSSPAQPAANTIAARPPAAK